MAGKISGKTSGKTSRKPYRVGRSPTGLGLFATEPIEKGAFIVEYKGRRITNAQAKRLEAHGSRYMYEINNRWTVDGSSRRNMGRYANHSCGPNAESDVVKGKVILRARKKIKPGEEITYDYGREYFDIFLSGALYRAGASIAGAQLRPPCARQSSSRRCSNMALASQIPPPTTTMRKNSKSALAMRRSRAVSTYLSPFGASGSSMPSS